MDFLLFSLNVTCYFCKLSIFVHSVNLNHVVMRFKITALLMLLTSITFSQSIKADQIDDFTKKRSIVTNAYEGKFWKKADFIDDKNYLLVSMAYTNETDADLYMMNFSILTTGIGLGCLSEYEGKIMFLFENDSTMECYQVSETECSSTTFNPAYAMFARSERNDPTFLEIMAANVERLKTNPIKKIRIYGTKGYYDFTLKPEKRQIIASHINLIQDKIRK